MAISQGIALDAFKVKAKGAIAFLKRKGFRLSWRHEEVWREAHAQVFTVAKVMKLDLLQDILNSLIAAQDQGIPFAAWQNDLEPILKQKGWWGQVPDPDDPTKTIQLGSPQRMKTIFETNIQQSYSAGKWQKFERMKATRPYVRYTAIRDGATRPAHRALHNKVFRIDDPALKVIAPKNGYNCRCDLVSVSASELERDGLNVEPPPELIERDVLISKATGELRKVQGARLANGQDFYPDAGFDFNPGETNWNPSLEGYDADLVKAYKKAKR